MLEKIKSSGTLYNSTGNLSSDFLQARLWEEWQVLQQHKFTLCVTILMTYFHSVATNIVYYNLEYYRVTQEQAVLHDLGFELIPELDKSEYGWIAELLTFSIIGFTIFWGASKIILDPRSESANSENKRQKLYAMNILNRFLLSASICFLGRCIAFNLTLLPSPAEHCRATSKDYDPPTTISTIFLRVDTVTGCGDLIFSSHTTYVTHCALTYITYGTLKPVKGMLLVILLLLGYLIVALRNHYSVDVWLAWFIVPFVWDWVWRHCPDKFPPGLDDNPTTNRVQDDIRDDADEEIDSIDSIA